MVKKRSKQKKQCHRYWTNIQFSFHGLFSNSRESAKLNTVTKLKTKKNTVFKWKFPFKNKCVRSSFYIALGQLWNKNSAYGRHQHSTDAASITDIKQNKYIYIYIFFFLEKYLECSICMSKFCWQNGLGAHFKSMLSEKLNGEQCQWSFRSFE